MDCILVSVETVQNGIITLTVIYVRVNDESFVCLKFYGTVCSLTQCMLSLNIYIGIAHPLQHIHDFYSTIKHLSAFLSKIGNYFSPLQATAGIPFCRSSFSDGLLSLKCSNSMYTVAQPVALSLCVCENLLRNCT